jgi:uncharacterized protein (TIGR02147 family)
MANRSHKILKSAYDRLKRQNPKFSIRAAATKVGVSHVFMLKLLKGTASVPEKKLPILIKVFTLDELAQAELREALVFDAISETLDAFPGLRNKKRLAAETFEEYPSKHFSVLDNWYDLAILDLLTCTNAPSTSLGMAKTLGLTSAEVEASLEKSAKLGLAQYEFGKWTKTTSKIRFPTVGANDITRRYYEQILERTKSELRKTDPEDFARRSVTNLSVAVDPDRVQEAKKHLQQAIYEIAQELATGTPREVYQFTVCLVPVTKT